MKFRSFFFATALKFLIVLPCCWWIAMSAFGAMTCVVQDVTAGECAIGVLLAPIISALPSLGDGEDTLAFRLARFSVLIISLLVALIWERRSLRKRSPLTS